MHRAAHRIAVRQGLTQNRTMETAKEQVAQILSNLPDDASLEDIQYHIYVRQKVQQGLADEAAGRTLTHAEVQQRLSKWLTK
jgi:predicted transcriptional regulator